MHAYASHGNVTVKDHRGRGHVANVWTGFLQTLELLLEIIYLPPNPQLDIEDETKDHAVELPA